MSPEKTNLLYEKYPNLYQQHKLPMTKTCMCWGFECGDGWFEIIDELSAKLEPMGVVAVQVKEKFGELRFYLESGSDEAYEAIEEAELKASVTCERCGDPGKRRGGSWISTLCDKCHKI